MVEGCTLLMSQRSEEVSQSHSSNTTRKSAAESYGTGWAGGAGVMVIGWAEGAGTGRGSRHDLYSVCMGMTLLLIVMTIFLQNLSFVIKFASRLEGLALTRFFTPLGHQHGFWRKIVITINNNVMPIWTEYKPCLDPLPVPAPSAQPITITPAPPAQPVP